MNREWFPWELNWLRRYGFPTDKASLDSYNEKPVEYITGWAEFFDQPLKVGEGKTLIPRLETEELVKLVAADILEHIKEQPETPDLLRIADIGTGSGVIAISIAQKLLDVGFNDFEILASDISREALNIARENQELWQIPSSKLTFVESDLLTDFPPALLNHEFDLMVANLPYIPTKRKNALDESVIAFEPEVALFGGEEGLDLINKLLIQAPEHLKRQAPVWLEVDDFHKPEQVLDFLKRSININVYPDLNNINRFWRLIF